MTETRSKVVILLEYVPAYRTAFLDRLYTLCSESGIDLVVGAGRPSPGQAARSDVSQPRSYVTQVRQSQWVIWGRRLTVRRLPRRLRDAEVLIVEQARRNLDLYRVLLPRRLWPAHRVAVWGHGVDFVHAPPKIERRLLARLTQRADHLFAYTDESARRAANSGADPLRTTVVMNTNDTMGLVSDLERIDDADIQAYSDRFQLRPRVALYIGGLDESKRTRFLLESAIVATASAPDLSVVIAGDGVDREAVSTAASMNAQIVYVGPVDGVAKATALARCDAVVMPGRVGLVAVDALVAHRPLVTCVDQAHAPEFGYLVEGTSAVVSENDPTSFAAAIVSTVRREPTTGAWSTVDLSDLTADAMARRFLKGIQSVLSTRRGPGVGTPSR